MDDSTNDQRVQERPLVFFITIVSARGLPRTTAGVTSNPFVRIKYGGQRFRTATVPKSLQPIWNESFIFPYQTDLSACLYVYDCVQFGRDTVIGELQIPPPEPHAPMCKWYSIRTRNRTVRDIGRMVVDSKHAETVGQIFVATSLLDPLELTAMGQGLELPEVGVIGTGDGWHEACAVEGVFHPPPSSGSPLSPTPKRRATLAAASTSLISPASRPTNSVGKNLRPTTKKKSFRHQSIDSTIGAMQMFWALCGVHKRLLVQSFGKWKLMAEVIGISSGSEEASKKQMLEAKFRAKAAQHKIHALETQLAHIHSDKYQREVISLKAQKEVRSELSSAISRAETAEAIIRQLEEELMGRDSRNNESGETGSADVRNSNLMSMGKRKGSPSSHSRSSSSELYESPDLPMAKTGDTSTSNKPPPPPSVPPPLRNDNMGEQTDSRPAIPHSGESAATSNINRSSEFGRNCFGHSHMGALHLWCFARSKYRDALWGYFTHWRRYTDSLQLSSIKNLSESTSPLSVDGIPPVTISGNEGCQCISVEVQTDAAANRVGRVDTTEVIRDKGGEDTLQRGALHIWSTIRSRHKNILVKSFGVWVKYATFVKVHEDVAMAVRRYNELKKQSGTYQQQVKAHWAKTETYMGKLKSMLADEKQKCAVLKAEKHELEENISGLKTQLEAKRAAFEDLKLHISSSGDKFSPSSSRPNSMSFVARPSVGDSRTRSVSNPEAPVSLGRPPIPLRPSEVLDSTQPERNNDGMIEANEIVTDLLVRSSSSETPGESVATPDESSVGCMKEAVEEHVCENGSGMSPGIHSLTLYDTLPADMRDWTDNDTDVGKEEKAESSTVATDAVGASDHFCESVQNYEVISTGRAQECELEQQQSCSDTLDYDKYALQQWENLYAEAQQQLAEEVYKREEAVRVSEELYQRLASIREHDQAERVLYDQLINTLKESNGRMESKDSGEPRVSLCPPMRRHSVSGLAVRPDLYGTGDSGQSTLVSPLKSARRKSGVMSPVLGKHTSDSHRTVVFSSSLKRVTKDSSGSDSDENKDNSDDSTLIFPELPSFTASLDEYSGGSQTSLSRTNLFPIVENPAIEAAMTAKIKPTSSQPARERRDATQQLPAVSGVSGPRRLNSMATDDEQMEAIWQQLQDSSNSGGGSGSDGGTNVRVAIRMRPLNAREKDLKSQQCVHMLNGTEVVVEDIEATQEHRFNFDFCFDANAPDNDPSAGSQRVTFDKLGIEVLTNAWNGYNASLFAYGQTGSGKSYSMMGTEKDPGIIPRVCRTLFYLIRRYIQENCLDDGVAAEDRPFAVEASYLEIYNEKIRDLLDPSRHNLRVREHPTTGVFVENLSTCAVESYKDVEDLLEMGLEQRTTASTNMNSESSRSHSVFTIVIRFQTTLASGKKSVRLCKLCLVDLAGSERANSTGATGARLKEGANINRSLSTLGRCISALAKAAGDKQKSFNSRGEEKKVSIPFRESVLTWLLRESLCGNAKTAMLATISPASINYGESLSTLRYANSAKQIFTQAVVNEDPTTKIITDLRNEVLRLREQLSMSQCVDGARPAPVGLDLKRNLLEAEEALRNYAKQWEAKQQSMRMVKSKLLKKRFASFGAGDLSQEDIEKTPFLVSLSNDPMLNMAIKIYIPIGNTLRIGQHVENGNGEDRCDTHDSTPPDLQIDGLGIEKNHCSIHHTPSGAVVLRNSPHASTYVNGRQLSQGIDVINSSEIMEVELRAGDRVVLGVCSHVFAFHDPRPPVGSEENLSSPVLPSHEQAVREVILGRVETTKERKERLAAMVWNLWKMPYHRRLFEERLVDALRAVREASTISHSMCPSSGVFFETTLGSTVDIAALHSLRIKDLFSFGSIMIRVRCCSLVTSQDEGPGCEDGAESAEQWTPTERLARCSRASLGMDSIVSGIGGELPTLSSGRLSMRRHRSSYTSQLQQRWKSEDSLLLFESSLSDFTEGLEVLRALYSSSVPLREGMGRARKYLSEFEADESGDESSVTGLVSIVGVVAENVLGRDRVDLLVSNYVPGVEDETLTIQRVVSLAAEVVAQVGLEKELFCSMFEHFQRTNSECSTKAHLSVALLNAFDASLHDGVVGCFDSPDVLMVRSEGEAIRNNVVTNGTRGERTTIGNLHDFDAVVNRIQALRTEKEALYVESESHTREIGLHQVESVDGAEISYQDGSWETVDDWVKYLDEASGNYYLYSASTNQSRWVE